MKYLKLLDEAIGLCDDVFMSYDSLLKDDVLVMRWFINTRVVDGGRDPHTTISLSEDITIEIPCYWIDNPLPRVMEKHFPHMLGFIEHYMKDARGDESSFEYSERIKRSRTA